MYKYKFAPYPKDRVLNDVLQGAIGRLYTKLDAIKFEDLQISDYVRSYFQRYLSKLPYSLFIPSYLLYWALSECDLPIEDVVLIDYGGGSGMLSLLAKEAGVGTVIYDDIFKESCENAQRIGRHLNLEADHYVNADVEGLVKYVNDNSLKCNTIVSYDVLEHIYDIEKFLRTIRHLSNNDLCFALASGANKYNPMINRSITKFHKLVEHHDREPTLKARDTHRAYLKIRKEMIQEKAPNLSSEEVDGLAAASRGLFEPDIMKMVELYIKTQVMPNLPEHPTNTCDPYNGNWAEHLMDIDELVGILRQESFSTQVLYGYYGNKLSLKALVGMTLNLGIRVFGKYGIHLSPYFILKGRSLPIQ